MQELGSAGRFRSTVGHYLAGRPPYADLLIQRVAALTSLGPRHRVLDLGCGPGQLARAFAPLVREVVAMDPEPGMLRVAAEASVGVDNVTFVGGGSADLPAGLGRFRLVVMGRSFHWMDRAETLRVLDGMIEPGGAVAMFHTQHAAVPENAWVTQFDAVRRRYAGDDPERPQRAGEAWVRHEAILLDSSFCRVEASVVFDRRTFEAVRLIDRALSMSTTSRDRLGARAEALARELTALIGAIAPQGSLTEVIESSALIGRRPVSRRNDTDGLSHKL
jgi:SAM-dependent methyltransferase